MAWIDRLQTAAYISPSGIRFEFQYENISMNVEKKTGEFDFSEIDGTYIQDLGRKGRKFPFTIYFSGPDYDTDSDSFFAALEEPGIGTLEHPLYGNRKVVPTGTISRRDDLVTGANQAVFSITFSETIVDINFPSSELNDKIDIQNSVDNLNENTSDQYATDLDIENEAESAVLQDNIINNKDVFVDTLESITKLNDEIDNAMTTLSNSIDTSVVDLIIGPGGIASQVLTLINAPSNIITSASAFIEGYGSIIDNFISIDNESANEYLTNLLFTSGSFGALSLSMLNSEFLNRPEAIDALESIEDIYDNITSWMDDNITAFEILDIGDIYSFLNQIFSKIVGYLVRLSFDLPKKIYLTLTSDRQLIELVAELYGDLDLIDFFIQTNDLTTDEIELLPIGKEVIYFE